MYEIIRLMSHLIKFISSDIDELILKYFTTIFTSAMDYFEEMLKSCIDVNSLSQKHGDLEAITNKLYRVPDIRKQILSFHETMHNGETQLRVNCRFREYVVVLPSTNTYSSLRQRDFSSQTFVIQVDNGNSTLYFDFVDRYCSNGISFC